MVHLFKMNNEVPFKPRQIHFLRECLPFAAHTESLKYRRWQDRQAYIGARYLLQEALRKLRLPIEMLTELRYTEYGRPYLPLTIDFNISHSGKFILLAISNVYRIGIDIEEIRKIEFDDFRNQFTDLEFLIINEACNKYAEFFRYWTIKEAVIKADGRGMYMDLKGIAINKNAYANGKTWYLKEINVSTGYVAHIATDLIVADDIKCHSIIVPEY